MRGGERETEREVGGGGGERQRRARPKKSGEVERGVRAMIFGPSTNNITTCTTTIVVSCLADNYNSR